jgi:ABC-type multidrug transport system permease subunit
MKEYYTFRDVGKQQKFTWKTHLDFILNSGKDLVDQGWTSVDLFLAIIFTFLAAMIFKVGGVPLMMNTGESLVCRRQT